MELTVKTSRFGVEISGDVLGLRDVDLNVAPLEVAQIAAGLGFYRVGGRSSGDEHCTWYFH